MAKVNIIDSFFSTKIGQKLINPAATAATAAAIATVSNVSKDAVNCAYYTTQSLNNKRIPEDQRKFVGALDLANGLMNVGMQIILSFGIADMITSIFDSKIAKIKDFSIKDEIVKEKYEKLGELKSKIKFEDFANKYKNLITNRKAAARLGFTVLTVNIAMQVLTKRILTPLAATPLASVFKKYFEKQEAKKNDANPQGENKVIAEAA